MVRFTLKDNVVGTASIPVTYSMVGSGTANTIVAPSAPTIGSASGGNASATISFTPGADGGEAPTYTVEDSTATYSNTGASSPIVVSGLTNGTSYTFHVKATNSAGTSAWSSYTSPVTPSAVTFTDGRDITTSNVGLTVSEASLTAYTGPAIVETDGITIENKFITDLEVRASNVTMRNCLIEFAGTVGLQVGIPGDYDGVQTSGFLMENCEIRSAPGVSPDDGSLAAGDRAVQLLTTGATFRYCYLHGSRRFFALWGSGHLFEWSYIGDNVNNTAGHTSAFGAWGGVYGVTIRGCNINTLPSANASGCIQIYPESSVGYVGNTANHDWLIEKNFLNTGGDNIFTVGWTYPWESPNYGIIIQDNWLGDAYGNSPGSAAWNHLELSNYNDIGSASQYVHAAFGDPWPNTSSWVSLTTGQTIPDHRGQSTNPAPTAAMANQWTNNRSYPSGTVIPSP